MPAPKGNKNAIGNNGGAPLVFTEERIAEETRALDEWSKRDDATALCQFCVLRDIHAQRVYEWRDQSVEFSEILKKAKMRIAARTRQKLNDNKYNYGLYMREAHFHDSFIHEADLSLKEDDLRFKKSLIDYEVKAKSSIAEQTPEQVRNMELLNEQLLALQEAQKQKRQSLSQK